MREREQRCMHDFGWKPEAKRPLGIPSRRWENNFKVDVKETEWTRL